MKSDTRERLSALQNLLARYGQDHLLHFADDISTEQREELFDDIAAIPWEEITPLVETHVLRTPSRSETKRLEPAPFIDVNQISGTPTGVQAVERGRELLRAGKVAAFTVAGGQGTRLGYNGPKGMLPATPVGKRSLFELFACMIKSAQRKYDTDIPWFIMTSVENNGATCAYFEDHDYFGLRPELVRTIPQGMLPVFDKTGRILLADRHRIAMAPDGHGGAFSALHKSASLDDMRRRGIEIISYFQVDNPLVRPFDPQFIGLHDLRQSEMSTKVASKAHDAEKVGNVCLSDQKTTVIEYSEFPEALRSERGPDGSRRFDAGNLAIHMISVEFADRMTRSGLALPHRRANKAVGHVNKEGSTVTPNQPNGVKLETFIFDALPFARNPLVLRVDRAEEFSPIKNKEGADSLATSHADQIERSCRWLEHAGLKVPRYGDGRPQIELFILPSFALEPDDVRARITEIPPLTGGMSLELS